MLKNRNLSFLAESSTDDSSKKKEMEDDPSNSAQFDNNETSFGSGKVDGQDDDTDLGSIREEPNKNPELSVVKDDILPSKRTNELETLDKLVRKEIQKNATTKDDIGELNCKLYSENFEISVISLTNGICFSVHDTVLHLLKRNLSTSQIVLKSIQHLISLEKSRSEKVPLSSQGSNKVSHKFPLLPKFPINTLEVLKEFESSLDPDTNQNNYEVVSSQFVSIRDNKTIFSV